MTFRSLLPSLILLSFLVSCLSKNIKAAKKETNSEAAKEIRLTQAAEHFTNSQFLDSFQIYTDLKNEGIKLLPENELKMADAAFRLRRYRSAVYHYKQAAAMSTEQSLREKAFVGQVLAELYLGNSATAQKELDLTANREEYYWQPEHIFLRAELILKQGNLRGALPYYLYFLKRLKGGELSNLKNNASFKIASIYLKALGDLDKGLAWLSKTAYSELSGAEQADYKLLYYRYAFKTLTEEDGLPENGISALGFDRDDLWIGTWLHGLARYNLNTGDISSYKAGKDFPAANTVRGIAIEKNRVWLATFDALCLYEKQNGSYRSFKKIFKKSKNTTSAVSQLKAIVVTDDTILSATLGRGLALYNRNKQRWKTFSTQSGFHTDYFTTALTGSKGIYVGTLRSGFFLLDAKKPDTLLYNGSKGPLQGKNVRSFAEIGPFLAVGTRRSGLYILDTNYELVSHFNRDNSRLASDYITAIQSVETPMGKKLFVGTLGGGLFVYTPGELNLNPVYVYNRRFSNSITVLKSRGSRLWIATLDSGIVSFAYTGYFTIQDTAEELSFSG